MVMMMMIRLRVRQLLATAANILILGRMIQALVQGGPKHAGWPRNSSVGVKLFAVLPRPPSLSGAKIIIGPASSNSRFLFN
jgi:hypothetical protein